MRILFFICLMMATPGRAQDGPHVKVYGFVLVNARYNTDSPADVPSIVATTDTASNFLITARQSRLGVHATQDYGKFKTTGEIEMDFYGLSGSSPTGGVNQSAVRLRLANVKLQFTRVTLTFGQAWSLFQPYVPQSIAQVAVSGLTAAGNLWNRFPQMRLDYAVDNFTLQAALLRPFGADVQPSITQSEQIGSGEKSGLPFLQGRAARKTGPLTLGISGHFGKEKLASGDLNTHAVAGDLLLQTSKVTFVVEAFVGANLPMFYSNIKTQANPNDGKIEAQSGKGGWSELSLKLSPQITLNASAGCEEVENGLLKNTAGIVNLMYALEPNLVIAGEASGIKTERENLGKATNVTFNLGCKFNF